VPTISARCCRLPRLRAAASQVQRNGGLTFFEVAGPAAYTYLAAAAQRLGLGEGATGYWALHIREDERHGRQMVGAGLSVQSAACRCCCLSLHFGPGDN
jgi:hypothetical protein